MSLNGKVVVITGATSGIGRAAAIEFAAQGCRVVLAGRRLEALAEAAHECRAAGGQAVTLQTDVTREEQVEALAALALEQTGVVDIWINNAGVTLFGPLEGTPFDEHRQVLETNLFGAMYGARAVLPIFRRQKRGVLINVGSILSKIGQPFVPSYVISKFALRGLTETLRAEVANEWDIHICSLLPYAVDTEHFESGANRIGQSAHAMPPTQSPEKVARALVQLARRPRRERHLPSIAVLGFGLHALFPKVTERVLFDTLQRWHFGDEQEAKTDGNLYRPLRSDGGVHGARPPRVSTLRLLAFALQRFVSLQAELIFRSVFRRAPGESRSLAEPASVSPRALRDPA
jgi:NAD(P)-dependent dehydrogenase (short-subunit alcohol dehydrogenase family)